MYFTSTNKSIYAQPSNINIEIVNEIIELYNINSELADIKLLIDQLDLFTQVLQNYTDINGIIILIKLLKIQINKNIKLENDLANRYYKMMSFDTSIKTIINDKYVKYIQKYGIPEDGIFIPILLNEFS